jgi:hypothetical protein
MIPLIFSLKNDPFSASHLIVAATIAKCSRRLITSVPFARRSVTNLSNTNRLTVPFVQAIVCATEALCMYLCATILNRTNSI